MLQFFVRNLAIHGHGFDIVDDFRELIHTDGALTVVFTVLNVLIGVVLNAMDEAREENRQRTIRMNQLSEIVDDVESMTVDGKISNEELQQLKKKVAEMERLLEEGK